MMKRLKQSFLLVLAVCIALGGFLTPPAAQAAPNDYVGVTKTVSKSTITTLDETEVILNITGTPPVNVVQPNDVVLVIDKSGSMLPGYNNGEDKMTNAKEAAKGFVDLMDLTKHRVAVVDFSSSNTIGTLPFTTEKDTAKNYINGITANGSTATGDAITVAANLLADHRPEAQPVIVIMTDGDATQPANDPYGFAKQKAQEAKDAGIIFYTIALLKQTDNPDTSGPNILMKDMATTASHHHFVLGSTGLSEIYAAIVKEIGLASAYDVKVTDIVGPAFEIVPGSYDNNIPKPTVDGNKLTWTFNELKNKTLTFTYKIRPVSKTTAGSFPVSTIASQIQYKDYAGANREKAIPNVNVNVKLPAPEVTSVVEAFGHPNGGETVTLNGNYFVSGATVKFGLNNATNVTFVDEHKLTVTVPKGSQGTVAVEVRNPDGQTAAGQYQYKTDPIITSLSPNSGPLAGGTVIAVQGNYLMRGVSVTIDGVAATVSDYYNPTYIKVLSPQGLKAGPADVVFTNPDGTSATVTEGFTYIAPPKTDPEILTISPNSGVVTGGDIILVDGKNFKNGMKVTVGGKVATTTFVSATRLKVTIPSASAPGPVDVAVIDLEGSAFTFANGYTYTAIVYPAPTITVVSPNSGLLAGGDIVLIDGTNFINNVTKAFIGSKEVNVSFVNSGRIRVTIPAGDALGKVDVKVANGDKEAVRAQGYEYVAPVIVPPTITSISPNNGLTTGGDIILIDGTGYKSGVVVKFNNTDVPSSIVSSTRLKVTVPAVSAPGKVDVTVTNLDGGTVTAQQGYEYTITTPQILSLSPNTADKVGGEIILIDGKYFDSTAKVTINGVNAAVTFVSTTRLKVTVPASPIAGDFPLVITLSNGQSVSTTFNYNNGPVFPAPEVTFISQTSGLAKGGDIIYIDGKNFRNKPDVYFGSVKATNVTFVSATRVKFTVPAGTVGPVNVKVVNPDGLESNTIGYTYT
ncbi:IPT/TIG domain-containing protein [Paenibacillus sp. NPDC058071]|uniref:IPT/TIG domain-containing protein n=1 Tax=Paenibacillus sp. NPDC058071 TaxID=3346326 RepID=UPI0036DBE1AE